jgi:hypothetical protein
MPEFGEYATVNDVRAIYLSSVRTTDDVLLLSFIRQASREIRSLSKRSFHPTIETRLFNSPNGVNASTFVNSALNTIYDIPFDKDLISLTSVINGDGTSVDITKIVLFDLNSPSKNKMRLLPTDGVWKNALNGYPDGAIAVTGVWGCVFDEVAGWQQVELLSGNITNVATTFAAVVNDFYAGDLIEIDSEMMYVRSIAAPVLPATTSTLTVVRAVNGSTNVAHAKDAPIYRWSPGDEIHSIAQTAVAAYYYLKSNPLALSYSLDGVNFSTPKDVAEYIRKKLAKLGLIRHGFA